LTGLNAARNRGAATARGDVLAFLDDDTLVSTHWASALLETFASYPCAAIGGRVQLHLESAAPDWLARHERVMLAEYDLGDEARWLGDDQMFANDPMPVGANCAVRRGELRRVGGFRPELDRRGRSLISNGDSEFFLRLRDAGGTMRYQPDASVVHCVSAGRLTIRYFRRRYYGQGISAELMARIRGDAPDPARLAALLRGLGGAGKMICRDALRRQSTASGQFWASYWTGRLVGRARARLVLDDAASGANAPIRPLSQRRSNQASKP